MKTRTVAQLKDGIRELNQVNGINIPKGGNKPDLIRNMVNAVEHWHTEMKKNESTQGLAAATRQYLDKDIARTPGTFLLVEGKKAIKAEIILFGKQHAKAKGPIFDEMPDELVKTTEKGKIPKQDVNVSHAIIRATDAKAKGTTPAGSEMATNLLLSGMQLDATTRALLADAATAQPDAGLFTQELVEGLVEGLNDSAPQGYSFGFMAQGDTFDEFVLYDITTPPGLGDGIRRPPYGVFQLEQSLKTKQTRLVANPPAQYLLDRTYGNYGTSQFTHQWFSDVLEFKSKVLNRFGLLPFAIPYETVRREVEDSFSGKMETTYSGSIEHGLPRDTGIAPILHLEVLDFEVCRLMIADHLEKSPFVHTATNGFRDLVRNSKTDNARNKAFRKNKAELDAWFKGGKKGRRPRRLPQTVVLEPEMLGDLQKIRLIEEFVNGPAQQGRAASIMNMLAAEERQVEADSGLIPNFVRVLRHHSQGKALSEGEQRTVDCLLELQKQSLFRPWGWANGVKGTSAGIDKRPRGGDGNFAGKFGHNHGCIQVTVEHFLGAATIALTTVPLSERAIANRNKYAHSKSKKPNSGKKRARSGRPDQPRRKA